VSLSRKRKKELRKLQSQANNLWEAQQVLVGEAASVAREARRQLGHFGREQVAPQVQETYGKYAAPYVDKGVKVSKHLNIGERPIYMKALNDGSIDFIPEYSGSILSYLDASATAKTPTDVYSALQKKLGSNLAARQYAQA